MDTLQMGAAGVAIEREISARKDVEIERLRIHLMALLAAGCDEMIGSSHEDSHIECFYCVADLRRPGSPHAADCPYVAARAFVEATPRPPSPEPEPDRARA